MAARVRFDPVTSAIEQFTIAHNKDLQNQHRELVESILRPLQNSVEHELSYRQSTMLLQDCFTAAEQELARIASQLSLDPWMSVLGRLPPRPDWPDGWERYLKLGLVRYAATERASAITKVRLKGNPGIVVDLTLPQMFDAFRLAALAGLLCYIAGLLRWIGKGARLRPAASDLLRLNVPPDVEKAVSAYDRRQPSRTILQDHGAFVHLTAPNPGDLPLLLLNPRHDGFALRVPRRNIILISRFFPLIVDSKPIVKLLSSYSEPIEDLFHTSVDAICHTLYALAHSVLNSLPAVHRQVGRSITLDPDDGSPTYDYQLRFLYRLCQTGHLRFSRGRLIDRLSEVLSPWGPDPPRSRSLVTSFLDGFQVRHASDLHINLSMLWPMPFVCISASDEVYVNIDTTADFLGWVLERAKEWYSSQHGDRFTLALKQHIERNTRALVHGWKMPLQATSGKSAEVDLLVVTDQFALAIECKAYAKTSAYLRGDPQAVDRRRAKIADAVRQSQEAAEAVRQAASRGGGGLPAGKRVEWVVCTPTQEYLRPPDEYGFLAPGVPRVCTPEELVSALGPQ